MVSLRDGAPSTGLAMAAEWKKSHLIQLKAVQLIILKSRERVCDTLAKPRWFVVSVFHLPTGDDYADSLFALGPTGHDAVATAPCTATHASLSSAVLRGVNRPTRNMCTVRVAYCYC